VTNEKAEAKKAMNERTVETYGPEADPEMMRYWMQHGSKAGAFLLVIPGAAVIGYGIGLLASKPLPCSAIGLGAGLFVWGVIVALTK
jgi:hypothetical protein